MDQAKPVAGGRVVEVRPSRQLDRRVEPFGERRRRGRGTVAARGASPFERVGELGGEGRHCSVAGEESDVGGVVSMEDKWWRLKG